MLLPACQEVCDPLTDVSWHSKLCEFGVEDFWDDGVEHRAEVHKEDPYVPGWAGCCRIKVSPLLRCLPGMQTAGGLKGKGRSGQSALVALKGFHDNRRQGNRPVVL